MPRLRALGGGLFYRLEGKIPVEEKDVLRWARWMEECPRMREVAGEWIGRPGWKTRLWVSTVFLGVDQGVVSGRMPQLFETMVFRPANGEDRREAEEVAQRLKLTGEVVCPEYLPAGYCERSATWELALDRHRQGVEWAREYQAAEKAVKNHRPEN
jgi:hypothetical protein